MGCWGEDRARPRSGWFRVCPKKGDHSLAPSSIKCPSCGSDNIGRPGLGNWRAWLGRLGGHRPRQCRACGLDFDAAPPARTREAPLSAWAEKVLASPLLLPVGAAVALLAGVAIYWAAIPSRQIPMPPSSRQAIMASATIITTSTTTTTLPAASAPAAPRAAATRPVKPKASARGDQDRPPTAQHFYSVQFGAFRNSQGSHALARRLAGKGIRTRVDQVQTGGKLWFKVRTGKFRSKERATQAAKSLSQKSGVPTVVALVRAQD